MASEESTKWPEHGPTVILGRGHSGTRFLAEAFKRQGIFIGGNLNPMFDSLTWLDLIQQVVLGLYPDYDRLEENDQWHRMTAHTGRLFLDEGYSAGPWGWKIGVSTFVIPLLAKVFPGLRVVHLIRDGRDVMLSKLRRVSDLPVSAFNRKIILGDENVDSWFGAKLTPELVKKHRSEFEMLAWEAFVTTARRYGSALGTDRYLEVRYEDLCQSPVETMERVSEFSRTSMTTAVTQFLQQNAKTDRIGKWHSLPEEEIAPALNIGRNLLDELGYN